MLWVPCTALTLLVGQQEEHAASKNLHFFPILSDSKGYLNRHCVYLSVCIYLPPPLMFSYIFVYQKITEKATSRFLSYWRTGRRVFLDSGSDPEHIRDILSYLQIVQWYKNESEVTYLVLTLCTAFVYVCHCRELVEKDYQAHKLNKKDAMDRNRCRKQIRDDWWPQ